jgi:hypothetical protein
MSLSEPALDRLDLTETPVKPEFAIAPEVLGAAHARGIILTLADDRADLACERCGQSVLCLRAGGMSYRLTAAAVGGAITGHLMQAHQWTREKIPYGG